MSTKKTRKPAPKKAPVKKPASKPVVKKPAVKKAAAKPAAHAKPAPAAPVAKANGKRHLRPKTPVEKKMKHPTKGGSLALTERDLKLLKGICAGKSYVDMAKELGYESGTLRVYAHHLYNKLGVEGKVQAAVFANEYLRDEVRA